LNKATDKTGNEHNGSVGSQSLSDLKVQEKQVSEKSVRINTDLGSVVDEAVSFK